MLRTSGKKKNQPHNNLQHSEKVWLNVISHKRLSIKPPKLQTLNIHHQCRRVLFLGQFPSALTHLILNYFSMRDSPWFSLQVPSQVPWSLSWQLMLWMWWCHSHLFLSLFPPPLLPGCLHASKYCESLNRDARSSWSRTDFQTHFISSHWHSLQCAETVLWPQWWRSCLEAGASESLRFLSSLLPKIKDKLASFSLSGTFWMDFSRPGIPATPLAISIISFKDPRARQHTHSTVTVDSILLHQPVS